MMKICIFLCTFLHAVYSITVYDARLTNGYYGAVEVLTHQGWLPVCGSSSSYWSTLESRVLCRQLGYDVTSNPSTSSSSSYSTSLVFDFSCTGNELQLLDCSYRLVSIYTSSSCSPVFTVSCAQCTEGSVQLRGGIVPEAGTVEFCNGGIWTAVCDSNWDYKDAFVVCRELGLPATEARTYLNSYFGDHPIPYGMYFNCFGNETSLNSCQKSATTCDFANVAGIHCTGDVITARCFEGILRLVDGRDENEGRIEICSNGVWGTIYAGGWDVNDASVICTQLGYHRYSRVEALQVSNGYFRAGTGPILYGNLGCTGTESRLSECSSSYYYAATHFSDAGVRCQRTEANTHVCDNGEARLVNGSTASEGRVEICYAGIWGSVCDNYWDDWDAAIVCMQLGFQGANATALGGSYFGDGDGPYHLSNVGCSGEERTLLECSHAAIGYHTCTPGRDAGVRCDASICTHNDLRLFGAESDYQYGIAEICINGFWADICYTGSYATTASKFCDEYYFGINSSSFGESCCPGNVRRNTGNLTLYDVFCSGSSDFFTEDCSYNIIPGYSSGGCNLQYEMIIGCYSQSTCTQNNIRIVDGDSPLEGRVEICYENLWGAITYHIYNWDANDAMVACRQLGLPWEWALADQNNLFGRGDSRIVAGGYECTGSEQQLSSCSLATYVPLSYGTSYQTHSIAGIICQGDTSRPTECEHGDVRLAGGETEMEGRVEFCSYGYWAVACDTYWDKDETTALCKQLGFPTEGSEFVLRSVFGSNYQLPLIGLSCGSGVSHISECQFHNQTSGCNHRRTAGIICKERTQHYQINVYVTPEQESYDIGPRSRVRVTLNCTATPSTHKYQNYDFPVTYHWYRYNRLRSWTTSSSHTTFLVSLRRSGDHYCSIYRNGLLLGTGLTTLHIRSVLRVNSTMSSLSRIDTTQGQNITFQVDTVDHDVVKTLLELTWYHNDTLLMPGQDPRFSLSDDNKTLLVTNFTSTYAGVYKAQFNQLFVHPYKEECKNELLSLLRSHHLLKPAIFCVNMKDCSESEEAQNRVTIAVQNSNTQGMLPRNLSFKAEGIVSNSRILKHASFVWYRSGSPINPSISSQKYYNNLSFSEEFSLVNTSFEHTGRYEVRLQLGASYFQESRCQSYYDRFVALYVGSLVTIASDHTDIYYSRGLILDFDGESRAATSDEGATLTCRASIEFPPFSMISLIKNGQTVATSSSGLIETNIKNINANPFGLYDCRLNASGAIFKKSSLLEEEVTLRMTIDSGRSNICRDRAETVIKEALLLKITNECRCTFGPSSIHDSSADCNSGQEIAFSATIQYSNEDGSETASTIAERIVGQVPFTMTVTGGSGEEVAVTVISACVDCRALVLTAAAGGGLFVGGFATAALIAAVGIVIVILVIRRRRHTAVEPDTARHQINKESKADTTRYTAAASRPVAAAGGAKKLKPQQQQQQPQQQKKKPLASAGNQPQRKPAKVDPKTLYDTPRAQKQMAGTSESGGSAGPSKPAATQKMEMSDDKDTYEALDAERESIYEETF